MSSGINSIFHQRNINSLNPNKDKDIYEFDRFRLDAAHLMIYENERPVALAPKVIETLLALVERRGEVVSKEEMMERLWHDSFVEESNLTQNIYLLRKTLGKGADGRDLIETFRRRGYRFNGEIKLPSEKIETLPAPIETKINESHQLNVEIERVVETKTHTIIEREIVTKENPPTVAQISATKNKTWILTAAALGALILAGVLFWQFERRKNQTAFDVSQSPQNIAFERLTPNQQTSNPAISPNGESVAYGKLEERGDAGLYLKNLVSGETSQILPPINKGYQGIEFSPDGKQIYFLSVKIKDGSIAGNILARVPVSGGAAEEVVENIVTWFALSPDGKQVAFVRDGDLVVAKTDKSGERVLAKRDGKIRWFSSQSAQPAWSPDGTRIVVSGGYAEQGNKRAELIEINVADGAETHINTPNWDRIGSAAWLSNESALLVIAREEANKPSQIWHVSYPNGAARRVTNDLNNYNSLSLSADSRRLVTEQIIGKSNVWLASLENLQTIKQITFDDGENVGVAGLAFTPDNRIVFTSPRSGNLDLWTMNADGGGQKQLTRNMGFWNGRPRSSFDGRYVVFQSFQDNKNQIWRIDADGANPLQLTDGANDNSPCFSPDGQWIYYAYSTDDATSIKRVSINGGDSSPVFADYPATSPSISPDGKLLAFEYVKDSDRTWKLGVTTLDGDRQTKLFDIAASRRKIEWAADSKSLIYIQSGSPNLWQKTIDDAPPRQLTRFNLEQTWSFAVSGDYRQIALARGNVSTETVLINLF